MPWGGELQQLPLQSTKSSVRPTEQQLEPSRGVKPSSCLFSSHGILWNKWTRKLKSPKHQPHTMLWGQSQPSLYFPSLFWALIACKTWAASSSVISPYQEIQMKLHSHRRLLEVYRSPACLYKRSFFFFPDEGRQPDWTWCAAPLHAVVSLQWGILSPGHVSRLWCWWGKQATYRHFIQSTGLLQQ